MLQAEITPAISTIIFKGSRHRSNKESGTFRWDGGFEAKYYFELHVDSGFMRLQYEWPNPAKPEALHQEIRLTPFFNPKGYAIWRFTCQGKHKRCAKNPLIIYLSQEKKFLCKRCAKVLMRYKLMANPMEKHLCNHPAEIPGILSSPYTSPGLKTIALYALDTLQKRLDLMKRRLYNMKLRIYYLGIPKNKQGYMKKNWELIVKKKVELLTKAKESAQ